MLELVVDYIQDNESSKPDDDSFVRWILIFAFSFSAQVLCAFVSLIRRMCIDQEEVSMDDIARIAFNNYLHDNFGDIPLSVFGNVGHFSSHFGKLTKGASRRPLIYSAFGSGLDTAIVSPASPTLNRAKRLTEMFSPNLPILVAMSCEIEMVWSLMKGCSYRQTSP